MNQVVAPRPAAAPQAPRRTGIVILLLAVDTAIASADGTFVWRNENADIREPEQKAIVLFDAGLEDLVLEVRYEGAPGDFGWIVPVPSTPRLRPDDARLFVVLSQATQEVRAQYSDRTHRLTSTQCSTSQGPDVTVIQRARVGIYDAAVLAARHGSGLQRWLRANGFRAPPNAGAIFEDYARRGWVFVALRITRARADSSAARTLASGTIQPVRFRFRTPEPVYPLRVSSLGSARENVLLYVVSRKPLIHRTCNRAAWTENACGPSPPWIELDPDSAFTALAGGHAILTKLRATVAPEQMEDVYFRAYDPIPGLSSRVERDRIESLAHMGWLKPRGAVAPLVRFLEERQGKGPETLTALWALGELGGAEAVAALMDRAERGPWVTRIEAVESLARLRTRTALPLYMRYAVGGSGSGLDQPYFVEACFEHLVAQGDTTCIGPLRWKRSWSWLQASRSPLPSHLADPADRLLAALAACGDGAARREIVGRLLSSCGRTADGVILGTMRNIGSINGFPSGFWPGVHLLFRYGHAYGGWVELDQWNDLLAGRPDVHDHVFRQAASDPRMTSLGRALLLGLLARPEPCDRESLLTIARRGMGAECLEVTFGAVRYNVLACTAAYALGLQHAAEDLMTLWRECPRADHDMRGEILHAMELADTSLVVPAFVEHVRSDWNTRAKSPAYAQAVLAWAAGGRFAGEIPGFDGENRDYGITSILVRRGDPATLLRLMTDPDLSPWVRLYWITQAQLYEPRMRGLVPQVRHTLETLEAGPSDSSLRRAIEQTRARFASSEKVYSEVVAPGLATWR